MKKEAVDFTLKAIRKSRSKPVQDALQSIAYLRAEMGKAATQGMSTRQIDRVKTECIEAIQLDAIEANRMETVRVKDELALLKDNYNKAFLRNAQSNDRIIQNAQRRFNAMSPSELGNELQKVMSGGYADALPEVLDELSYAIKTSLDEDSHDSIRSYLQQMNYSEPWANSEAGKAIKAELKYLEQAGSNLVVKTDDNKLFSVSPMELESMLDTQEEPDKEDADHEALQ